MSRVPWLFYTDLPVDEPIPFRRTLLICSVHQAPQAAHRLAGVGSLTGPIRPQWRCGQRESSHELASPLTGRGFFCDCAKCHIRHSGKLRKFPSPRTDCQVIQWEPQPRSAPAGRGLHLLWASGDNSYCLFALTARCSNLEEKARPSRSGFGKSGREGLRTANRRTLSGRRRFGGPKH
jgi:hypothetical protein